MDDERANGPDVIEDADGSTIHEKHEYDYDKKYEETYAKYGFRDNRPNDTGHRYGVNISYADSSVNEEEEFKGTRTSPFITALRSFPYPILCLIAFLLMGFLGDLWHPGWVIFLTILPYYTAIESYSSNGKIHFPFSTIVVIVYLLMGFIWGLWHPGWVIFFTIPLYWWLSFIIKSKFTKFVTYPIFCVLVFLILGFAKGLWHPTWILFLTIPIYASVQNSVKAAIAAKKAREQGADGDKPDVK